MLFGIRRPRLHWRMAVKAGRLQLRGVVGILGYGVDGRGVGEFLEEQLEVEEVRVFDDAQRHPEQARSGRPSVSKGGPTVTVGTTLDGVNLLFRSPGFPLTHPLVAEARERGIPITSSTSYFLQHFPGVTVGITGSNGKTTCSTLIAKMLREECGEDCVEEGGNDRTPRLDLLTPSSKLPAPRFAVLELSSFQLIDCPVSPNVAVVLNVTPNHLDWHASMAEYAEAKRRIVSGKRTAVSGQQPIAVLNEHDPIVRTFADGLKGVTVHWFANCQLPTANCRFKTHPDTVRAAVTTARALGVSDRTISTVLEGFPGVPHRLEFIREIDGVRYYNDSSCTTPESAIVACEAFPAGSVILLLGGRDKGMDFTKLYEVIEERNVRVVPYGEMADVFVQNLPTAHRSPLTAHRSFEAGIADARAAAHPGDNIVLSPACASFDMFANAKERGRRFTELVQGL